MTTPIRPRLTLPCCLALLAAACGDDGNTATDTAATSTVPSTTVAPSTTDTPTSNPTTAPDGTTQIDSGATVGTMTRPPPTSRRPAPA